MLPHGTTVLALRYRDGVVIAGDRMATEGYSVSERRIEKVHNSDKYSAIAIAGAAGPALELTRLFRIELEHYEKLEGAELSLEGKANKLSQMIKGNLPMAMQGLVVIPIFAGYDIRRNVGRIFKYDIAGGQYEEIEYYAIGSGGRDARGTLKKIYSKDADQDGAIRAALEALYDASEADIATGGPDLIRGIFPTVKAISAQGISDISDAEIKQLLQEMIQRQGGG
ncbi:MAG: proteasome subunit beta [Nitrospirae bacterium]|nr:proteasome subunit beta [Candidatus Manganitrophaceae bacterium]